MLVLFAGKCRWCPELLPKRLKCQDDRHADKHTPDDDLRSPMISASVFFLSTICVGLCPAYFVSDTFI
jgi:hypothetical protein